MRQLSNFSNLYKSSYASQSSKKTGKESQKAFKKHKSSVLTLVDEKHKSLERKQESGRKPQSYKSVASKYFKNAKKLHQSSDLFSQSPVSKVCKSPTERNLTQT